MIKTSDIKEILFEASLIIEKYFNMEIKINYKEDESPVTIADFETNEFLKKHLLELMPEAGWLSEEEVDNAERLKKEYVWVVDPLDGTKEFVEKIPDIAISVGLVKNNIPILGAVINPITKECGINNFDGGIDFWNIEKKEESLAIENAHMIVSRTEYKKGKIKPFESFYKNIRPVGSVAYKLLRIAAGADHLYFSVEPKSEWDICGGISLINSVGKRYIRFDGEKNLFNQKDVRILSGAVAGSEIFVNKFLEDTKKLI